MAESDKYRPSFSDLAAEFILSLPRRRQRKVMERAYLLVDGVVFSYWVDHALKLVMITEIEDTE